MKLYGLAFVALFSCALAWVLLSPRAEATIVAAPAQFGCSCHASANLLNQTCPQCGISYSNISTTNAACTPTCQLLGNYCSAEATMTFSGCSTDSYALKALAPCYSTGNSMARCPGQNGTSAGIEVVCGECLAQ